MWVIAIDAAHSVVCLFVCLPVNVLITTLNPAKTAESIEMPFRGRLAWAK